jgi:bifunctional DNA-binding transcriptional regulator/antitoxin component of YhaV-PrlF toxin-antitoxin module
MIEGTIFIDSKGRASIHIPSYIAKKYGLQNGEKVGIDDEGGLIIIDLRR